MKFLATSQKLALKTSASFDSDSIQFVDSVPEIVEKYQSWVSEDKYMILNRMDLRTFKSEVFAVKCSKRGNDVYRYRVKRRFNGLASLVKETVFFNPKDRRENKNTKALFVTLTYDTKRGSFYVAWQNIGTEFNCFMAYVRKKFGRVSSCRVFEAYENGHPHIHCILLFEKTEFKAFRDNKGKFRIKEKEVIAKGWHSHVDVRAIDSLGRGFSYLQKYLSKSIDKENKDSKTLKTLALGWFFKKRAFSVSGKFKQLLADLIMTKHNSNHKKQQVSLDGWIIEEYRFFFMGIVSSDLLGDKNGSWFFNLTNEQIKRVNKELEKQIIEKSKNRKEKLKQKVKKKIQGWI